MLARVVFLIPVMLLVLEMLVLLPTLTAVAVALLRDGTVRTHDRKVVVVALLINRRDRGRRWRRRYRRATKA